MWVKWLARRIHCNFQSSSRDFFVTTPSSLHPAPFLYHLREEAREPVWMIVVRHAQKQVLKTPLSSISRKRKGVHFIYILNEVRNDFFSPQQHINFFSHEFPYTTWQYILTFTGWGNLVSR